MGKRTGLFAAVTSKDVLHDSTFLDKRELVVTKRIWEPTNSDIFIKFPENLEGLVPHVRWCTNDHKIDNVHPIVQEISG